MNLNKIKTIIESYPEQIAQKLILIEISKDKDAIPYIMEMLRVERENNNDLILEMNLNLSRLDIYLENPKSVCGTPEEALQFVQSAMRKIWEEGKIHHCFKENKK